MNICKVHNVSNYVRNDHLTAVIEVRLYQLVACDSFGMIGAKNCGWLPFVLETSIKHLLEFIRASAHT